MDEPELVTNESDIEVDELEVRWLLACPRCGETLQARGALVQCRRCFFTLCQDCDGGMMD